MALLPSRGSVRKSTSFTHAGIVSAAICAEFRLAFALCTPSAMRSEITKLLLQIIVLMLYSTPVRGSPLLMANQAQKKAEDRVKAFRYPLHMLQCSVSIFLCALYVQVDYTSRIFVCCLCVVRSVCVRNCYSSCNSLIHTAMSRQFHGGALLALTVLYALLRFGVFSAGWERMHTILFGG